MCVCVCVRERIFEFCKKSAGDVALKKDGGQGERGFPTFSFASLHSIECGSKISARVMEFCGMVGYSITRATRLEGISDLSSGLENSGTAVRRYR